MKGNKQVVELLNSVLTWELTSINQYFLHSEMCSHWGYKRMHGVNRKHSIEEMKHAEELIERILYLEGLPNVQRMNKVNIGETIPEMLKSDYDLEGEAIPMLNNGIELCRGKGDNGSRLLLEKILAEEEEHWDWLDAQLGLLDQVGEQNYLAQQIKD